MNTNQFAVEPELVDPTIAELTSEATVENNELETTEESDVDELENTDESLDASDEDLDKEFEQVDSARTALESYVQILKQMGPEGISQQTATILNLGLKHTYAQLGLQQPTTGLEDYASGKLIVSIEELEEKKKGVLARLWELILKGLNAVADFVKKIFSKVEKMQDEAADLRTKAKASKGTGGIEFSIGLMEQKLVWDSIDADQTLLIDSKNESSLAKFLSVDIPTSAYDTMISAMEGADIRDESPLMRTAKAFNDVKLSDGSTFSTGADDRGEFLAELTEHPNPKLVEILKTRTPNEIDKCCAYIEEVLREIKSRPLKQLNQLQAKAEQYLKSKEGTDDGMSSIQQKNLVSEIMKTIQVIGSHPILMQANIRVLKICYAKLVVIKLELVTSVQDDA